MKLFSHGFSSLSIYLFIYFELTELQVNRFPSFCR